MGYVVRLKRNQLVGGNNNDEIYPITSTNAVYRGGKNLEDILDELGRDIDSKKVIEVSYNKSTNSIKVTYSNGDVDNYTLIDCVKDVSFNNSTLTFTKTDGTETSITIQKPNNGTLSLKKGSTIVNFTADSSEDKTVNIPNVYIDAVGNGNEFLKHGASLNVDGTRVDFPKIIMIPTFGVDKSTYLANATNLKNAIYSRNLNGLQADNDVCVYDFIDDGGERTAVMYPRLPKVVAAVSTNGDKLRITYLEDKETSGQSYTDIDLPSGGSNVSVSNKNATLTANSTVTIATITIDGVSTNINVKVPNYNTSSTTVSVSANNPTLERKREKVIGSVTVNGESTQLKINAGDMVTSSNVADIVFTDKSTFNSLKNSGALISSRLYLVQAETSA